MDPRVVLLAALLSCSSGVLGRGPPETVLALAGGDVTLPCSFSIPASEDFPTVEWSKEGLQPDVVFLYRDGCETPEMKNPAFLYRTSLITKDGNGSLRISNVQLTDAGKYKCMRLWRKAPRDITVVELVVGAVSEPKLSVTSAEGGGVTLQCAAVCWLPEPKIYFLDERGNDIAADEPKRDRDARGCFSVTRRATLQDATNRVTCRVHQPEINQTRDVEMLLPGVGRCRCFLPVLAAVAVASLLCGASCGFAVFLWQRCRTSAEAPNSPTSSYQSRRSCSCEDKSLLQSVQVIGPENRRNSSIEMLMMKVRELKLKEKDDAILQRRSDGGAQLIDVVCQNDVFLDSPAASTNSSPPTSGSLAQSKRKGPGILRRTSHPAPGCSIDKLYRRHSSPAHLNCSGSGPSEKRPGRIKRSVSDPRAFGLGPNQHSSMFPSPATSNSPFTRLANVTEESEIFRGREDLKASQAAAAVTPDGETRLVTVESSEEVQRAVSVRSGRMLLTPFCLVLSCLQVVPDRSQFYRYNSISLSCEDQLNATGWKVKRRTPEGGVRPCTSGWGTTSSGSACVISNTYPSDTGVYWCESADGNRSRSNSINITITDSTVLLESPALPVSEGAAMTLRCKAETGSPSHTFDFLKDGRVVRSSATGEMTVHRASKADEGLYVCSIPGFGKSLGSWVNVEGSLAPSSSTPPAASRSVSVTRLMVHVLVGTPYLLSTILLALIYRDRSRAARTVAERSGSNNVVMEVVV
ncbi:uncharacterized protein PEZ65_021833 [Lycodopsis pacificus]